MILGYNTNGFAHHRLSDATTVLREIGYRSVAWTIEHHDLDPPDRSSVAALVTRVRGTRCFDGLALTIETGARFILDPRRKHQPTLVSGEVGERQRRVEFIRAAIDVAAELGAGSVSLWSGAADSAGPPAQLMNRLTESLREVLQHAQSRGVRIAFEPEPGMFIQTMAQFAELHDRLTHPLFGLTLDVGHVHCLGDGDVAGHIRQWRERLWNVHIEDMRRGAHEHVMFGEGEMEFAPLFAALREIDYQGPVHVELPRHAHDAVNTARAAWDFLRPFLGPTESRRDVS